MFVCSIRRRSGARRAGVRPTFSPRTNAFISVHFIARADGPQSAFRRPTAALAYLRSRGLPTNLHQNGSSNRPIHASIAIHSTPISTNVKHS